MHIEARPETARGEYQHALREVRRTLDAVLEERAQLAQALHDHVIQRLYAVGLCLRTSMRDVEEDPEGAAARIDATIQHINSVIGDVRSYIERMELPRLAPGHLHASLKELAATLSHSSGLPVELHVEAKAIKSLSSRDASQVFYIAEEALSNSLRHARASAVRISLRLRKQHVHVAIRDDGQGFDLRAAAHHRLGLRNMRDRAAKLGATLRIDTASGQGTSVHLHVPLAVNHNEKPLARVPAVDQDPLWPPSD